MFGHGKLGIIIKLLIFNMHYRLTLSVNLFSKIVLIRSNFLDFSNVEIGVTSDGRTIVCYHPTVDIPYELTRVREIFISVSYF